MWTTVLLFGIAVNFEPNRLGLIALMMSRRRPVLQLVLFLGTAFTIMSTVGLAVLFLFHRLPFSPRFNGPLIQFGMGVAVLLLAAVLALKPSWLPDPRRARVPCEGGDTATGRARRVDLLATRVIEVAQSESRWFSTVAGAGIAMPTVEYMALLALIIGSQTSPMTQAAALFTFLALGNLVGIVPILWYLVTPDQTRDRVLRFNGWIRSRRRRDVVILLLIIGTALVATGATHL